MLMSTQLRSYQSVLQGELRKDSTYLGGKISAPFRLTPKHRSGQNRQDSAHIWRSQLHARAIIPTTAITPQSNAVHFLGEAVVTNFLGIRITTAVAACLSRLPITEARGFGTAASPIKGIVGGAEWR